MVQHTFRGRLWEHSPGHPGSWHFLTVPPDLSEDIVLESGPREGFGSIPVAVTLGDTAWRTSLFPDAASGGLVLPVKKQVREVNGLAAGMTCGVTLEVAPPLRG